MSGRPHSPQGARMLRWVLSRETRDETLRWEDQQGRTFTFGEARTLLNG